jgi:hypothetical protein
MVSRPSLLLEKKNRFRVPNPCLHSIKVGRNWLAAAPPSPPRSYPCTNERLSGRAECFLELFPAFLHKKDLLWVGSIRLKARLISWPGTDPTYKSTLVISTYVCSQHGDGGFPSSCLRIEMGCSGPCGITCVFILCALILRLLRIVDGRGCCAGNWGFCSSFVADTLFWMVQDRAVRGLSFKSNHRSNTAFSVSDFDLCPTQS